MVYCVNCTAYSAQFTVYGIHYTLYTVHSKASSSCSFLQLQSAPVVQQDRPGQDRPGSAATKPITTPNKTDYNSRKAVPTSTCKKLV